MERTGKRRAVLNHAGPRRTRRGQVNGNPDGPHEIRAARSLILGILVQDLVALLVACGWKCRVRVRGRRLPVSVTVLLDSGEQRIANRQLSRFAEAGDIELEVRG